MFLCVGPEDSGKTLLLRQLKNLTKPPIKAGQVQEPMPLSTAHTTGVDLITLTPKDLYPIFIRELGGCMFPIWKNYYRGVTKVIYVVNANNLTQVGGATLLLMDLLAHPHLRGVQVAVVFNKTEAPLLRNCNEIMNIMRFDDLKQFASQTIVNFEVSAFAGKGIRPLLKWILPPPPPEPKLH
ncbi:unnamed protein product, partial [Meganyctiphanes norvegica]